MTKNESGCICPIGPEDAHFPDCPWYVRHPEGTPEHAAYRAELRAELDKFAHGGQ